MEIGAAKDNRAEHHARISEESCCSALRELGKNKNFPWGMD